jgi:hypothetical protein
MAVRATISLGNRFGVGQDALLTHTDDYIIRVQIGLAFRLQPTTVDFQRLRSFDGPSPRQELPEPFAAIR